MRADSFSHSVTSVLLLFSSAISSTLTSSWSDTSSSWLISSLSNLSLLPSLLLCFSFSLSVLRHFALLFWNQTYKRNVVQQNIFSLWPGPWPPWDRSCRRVPPWWRRPGSGSGWTRSPAPPTVAERRWSGCAAASAAGKFRHGGRKDSSVQDLCDVVQPSEVEIHSANYNWLKATL